MPTSNKSNKISRGKDKALEQSHSLLAAALDSTADGILVVDNLGKVTALNKKFLELWRIPENLAKSKDDHKLLAFVLEQLRDSAGFLSQVKWLYQHPKLESNDVIEFRDGRVFQRYSKPQKLGHKIVGRVWSFRDVSLRRKAEQELVEWRSRYELVVASSNQVVYDYDLLTGKIIWSSNLREVLGYDESQTGHINLWNSLIEPEDLSAKNELYLQAKKSSSKFDVQYRFHHKDGTLHYYHDKGTFIANDLGEPVRLLGIMNDITERKKIEQTLRENERFVNTIASAIPDLLYVFDLPTKRNIFSNRTITQMLGYSDEEIARIGDHVIAELMHPEDLKNVPEIFELLKVLPDQAVFESEYRMRNSMGEWCWFLAKNKAFKRAPNGDVLQIIGVSQEITKRKKADLKIVEQNAKLSAIAENLLRKNEQLEEFTQIVSHNLRSPVGNISTLLALYNKTSDDQEKTELVDYLNEASHSLLNTLQELNEVLKIKQTEGREKQDLEFEPVMKKVMGMFTAKITQMDAEVTYNFQVPQISYSKIYLESILLNLLSNSLKYHHPDRPPRVNFRSYSENGCILLDASDNGYGINLKKYGHQIFKMRKTFHDNPDSRGIGLFMVKNQVEAMGGEITVESVENEGATFRINFNKNDVSD